MKQSKIFYTTYRESPKDEASANAKFLIMGGFIDKVSAGVFTFLPLGLRVAEKIKNIIREELIKIGGQELLMPSIHPKENWILTGRWDAMTDLYKIKEDDKEFALGPTHEEIVVPLAKKYVKSWRDLPLFDEEGKTFPLSLFQFQTKFRKELRAKSGLLRAKEFLMKDLYSFHRDQKDLDAFYDRVKKAYENIFIRLGLSDKMYYTYASGGTFAEYSHEFQLLTPAGEDTIFICEECEKQGAKIAVNQEIKDKTPKCPECNGVSFRQEKGIEVANIFKLMTKFSDPFGLNFVDESGNKNKVIMGCYGIGIGRTMGALAEVHNDQNGIIWPKSVAPFELHLIAIDEPEKGEALYDDLKKAGYDVFYDDRDQGAGAKFIDADLIGVPLRIVISKKTLEKESVEIKERQSQEIKLVKIEDLPIFLKGYYVKH